MLSQLSFQSLLLQLLRTLKWDVWTYNFTDNWNIKGLNLLDKKQTFTFDLKNLHFQYDIGSNSIVPHLKGLISGQNFWMVKGVAVL